MSLSLKGNQPSQTYFVKQVEELKGFKLRILLLGLDT